MTKSSITVARGDGIGPEIMEATLRVLDAANAQLNIEEVTIGQAVYEKGVSNGIEQAAWDTILRNKTLLKAPITTPQGGGFKSLNVTIRKALSLFANVRPCRAYAPYVPTLHPDMNVVIVRENEEDLYGGIEHQQSDEVVQCLKIVTRPGCERIIRYAFEYARAYGRKKVTSCTKDNIMKMTDGMFHRIFDEVAAEYPDIEAENWIIDIGAARLADTPEQVDVLVTLNLYGDILSDIASQIAGSVGMGVSMNIGENYAMFEAVHGSAPTIAGQDIANPSGLLMSAVQMLVHLGQADVATNIENAWLTTLEEGIHTADIYDETSSKAKVGTQAFADEICARLGQVPSTLIPVSYSGAKKIAVQLSTSPTTTSELVGVDVFVRDSDRNPESVAARLQTAQIAPLPLQMISNRGQKVWPNGLAETFCIDVWRCRFANDSLTPVTQSQVVDLQRSLTDQGIEIVETENLYTFDGERGFSLSQGQ